MKLEYLRKGRERIDIFLGNIAQFFAVEYKATILLTSIKWFCNFRTEPKVSFC